MTTLNRHAILWGYRYRAIDSLSAMIGYFIFVAISAATYAIFSMGLNLQWGVTGLINFGHVAFMTIGAYTTVLMSKQGIPIPVAVICGGALAAGLGLLLGTATLRLREDYLGIVTIGGSELVRLIAKNEGWLTNGVQGVQSYPVPLDKFQPDGTMKTLAIAWLTVMLGLVWWKLWQSFKQQRHNPIGAIVAGIISLTVYICGALAIQDYTQRAGLLVIVLTVLGLVYLGLEKLVHSPWGRVLKAIREDEEVPKALGKNVFWYKMQSFMLGGAIAGISGAFYAWQFSVYPDNFEPLITFNAWIIVMLGGSGNNLGTILGAIIYWSYFEFTRTDIFKAFFQAMAIDESRQGALRMVIIGLILIVLMMFRPQGILGNKDELTLGR
jgi:neutral amino acid transport system permease protein